MNKIETTSPGGGSSNWNVYVGCGHECSYCFAKKVARSILKHTPHFRDGFKPHLVEKELTRSFKSQEFVCISWLGDISFATTEELERILERARQFPQTEFLLLTKDPARLLAKCPPLPENFVVGASIESNRDYSLSKAPQPIDRLKGLSRANRRSLSLEPVLDFDLDILVNWVESLHPEYVVVGPPYRHTHLSPPSPEKLSELLFSLKGFCQNVVVKKGLETVPGSSILGSIKGGQESLTHCHS